MLKYQTHGERMCMPNLCTRSFPCTSIQLRHTRMCWRWLLNGISPLPDVNCPVVQGSIFLLSTICAAQPFCRSLSLMYVGVLQTTNCRPDAQSNIKIEGSGNILRWLGKPGEGLMFPAWLASSIRLKNVLPPHKPREHKQHFSTIIFFWVDAGDTATHSYHPNDGAV